VSVIAYTDTALATKAAYHTIPESTSWTAAGTIATSNFRPSDGIGADTGIASLALIGNGLASSTNKVSRTIANAPFGDWAESDSGLPQSGATSAITDLEMVG